MQTRSRTVRLLLPSILCAMLRRDQAGVGSQVSRFRALALGGSGLIAGALAYASLVEPRTILLRELEISLPTLPASLSGLRLAFISDFHVGGPGDSVGSIQRAISVLEDERPDLIMLGGDFYDRGVRVPDEPDWSRFPAIAPTFAIPGNHDYHRSLSTSEEVMRLLDDSGICILRNTSQHIALKGGTVRIIGLDDPYTGRADFGTAIHGLADNVHPTIMLAHAGLVADNLPGASADLILSGHTHGAQVRFSPFRHTGPIDIFWWLDFIKGSPLSPYRQGMFRVQGSLLYVGNGLGTTSLGIRFLAPPEVAIFTLARGNGRQDLSCDDPDRYVTGSRKSQIKPGA
jgi:uncharacterized protein